jgi:hypothetical protein
MYSQIEQLYRKKDDIKIVRRWDVSPVIYGLDSRDRKVNPDYHPTVCQREDGTYCDPAGRPLPKSKIPKYILEDGSAPEPTSMSETLGKTRSLADAMRDTGMIDEHGGVHDAPPEAYTPPAPKRRGRPRKNK